jgi:hypothetical protein
VAEYDDDDGPFPTPIDSMSMNIVHRVTLEDSPLRAPETLQILKDILGDLGSCEMVQTPVIAPTAISPSPSACWSSKRHMETYPEPDLIPSYPPTKRRRLSESDDDIGSDLSSVALSNPMTPGQWHTNYEELCQYHKQRGHCSVQPKDSYSLWRWIKRQRYLYKLKQENRKSNAISDERIALLERIGFVWDSQGTLWNQRLEELEQYCRNNGHCNVPSKYPRNAPLSTWVKCQRRQYKLYRHGGNSNMTEERMEALSNLGFVFTPREASETTKPV